MKIVGGIFFLFVIVSIGIWFLTQFTGIEPVQSILTFIAIGILFIAINSFEILNRLRKEESKAIE
ncbi:hypothetical protein D3C74_50150 [compost metagenome]